MVLYVCVAMQRLLMMRSANRKHAAHDKAQQYVFYISWLRKMKIVGNSRYQKEANALLILNLLRRNPTSRVNIAHELGLQNSTVSYNIVRLLENGSILEGNPILDPPLQQGKKGPKANLMKLNPEFGRVVGIEMMSSLYRIFLSDITGTPLFKAEFPYSTHQVSGSRALFEDLVDEVLVKASEICGTIPLLGVCIAVPGIVMEGNICIDECWTHGLYKADFSKFLTRFPFPVIFENDANCCAVKYLFNNEDAHDSYFYLLSRQHRLEVVPEEIPTIGLGLGIVIRGKLFRGTFARSGEFRSSSLMGTGLPGQVNLTKDQMLHLETDLSIRKMFIRNLLADLFCTISIFDPRTLYIGGFLATAPYRETLTEVFQSELTDSWLQDKWQGEMILVHETLFDPAEGAADLVLDLLFRVPQIGHTVSDTISWNALLKDIL